MPDPGLKTEWFVVTHGSLVVTEAHEVEISEAHKKAEAKLGRNTARLADKRVHLKEGDKVKLEPAEADYINRADSNGDPKYGRFRLVRPARWAKIQMLLQAEKELAESQKRKAAKLQKRLHALRDISIEDDELELEPEPEFKTLDDPEDELEPLPVRKKAKPVKPTDVKKGKEK